MIKSEQELATTLQAELALMSIGASSSLDVVVSTRSPFLDLLLGGFVNSVDSRLRLRVLLSCPPEPTRDDESRLAQAITSFNMKDWNVKTANCFSDVWCVIMDESQALVAQYPRPNDVSPLQITWEPSTRPLTAWFSRIWEGDISTGLLYEDIFMSETPEVAQEIVTVSQEQWDNIITELAKNPDLLHTLTPRKFEELVAEILNRRGLQVRLTPQSRDGGFDLLAVDEDLLGKHLYLVECKRQSPERPVGVGIVRALNGVVEQKRASGGIVVTTSSFTGPALQLAEKLEYRISLKEMSDLRIWLATVLQWR